ncbi:DUF4189 domain-containing protein, partial [Mycobacterium xenopi]
HRKCLPGLWTNAASALVLSQFRRHFRCSHADQITGTIHGFRLRTRTTIAASGTALAVVLTVAMAPAANAQEEWGAIAVSPDGKSVGVATNKPNEYQANLAASSECQQNNPICNVLITFKYPDCGAVVQNGNQYFGDSGATQQEAERNATNQSPGSTVLRSACNNPPAGATSTSTTTTSTSTTTTTSPTTTSGASEGE